MLAAAERGIHTESAIHSETRLLEDELAIEAARLLRQFKQSAGGPPKFITSGQTRLSFERVGDREELRVSRVNLRDSEEHIIIIAEDGRGAIQYSKVSLDGSIYPEAYAHSRNAVTRAEKFLRELNIS